MQCVNGVLSVLWFDLGSPMLKGLLSHISKWRNGRGGNRLGLGNNMIHLVIRDVLRRKKYSDAL